MKGWLLDTNVIASLIAPDGARSVKVWVSALDERRLFLSVLTLAEYDKGIAKLPPDHADRDRYAARRDALEERFRDRVLPLGDRVVRRWGAIAGRVAREHGHAPPVVDTLLAATAIEADLYLATRNVKDVRHSGAALFDPWNDDPSLFPISPA